MNLEVLKQTLASLDISPDKIDDERYAKAFRILFAIIEIQNEEIEALKAENQKLRDEINLLKGEQTKPKISGSKKNDDISSEKERKERKPLKNRESNSRKGKIEIHHTETCRVERSILPDDAVFKGYRCVMIRDIQTVTDKGTKANDTFMTIVQTAKKLGVSAYDYIFDRVSNKFEMLSLAQLIREKSVLN